MANEKYVQSHQRNGQIPKEFQKFAGQLMSEVFAFLFEVTFRNSALRKKIVLATERSTTTNVFPIHLSIKY